MNPAHLKKLLVPVALAIVFGAGLFVRVHGLGEYYLTPDDAFHNRIVMQPTLAKMWGLARREPHAPISYLIQYSMFKFERDPFFIRWYSVGAGLCLILASFVLGRSAAGNVAGLVMAAVAAFGYGPVLTSATPRVYMLAGSFFSLGLAGWLGWVRDHRTRWLPAVGLLFALAFQTSYPLSVTIAATFIIWALSLALRRQPAREWRNLTLSTIPIAAAIVIFYLVHGRYLMKLARFSNPVEGWVRPYFFSSPLDFFKSLYHLFGYFTLPPLAGPAIVLCGLGLIVLWRRGRPELALIFLLALGLNVLATAAERYPFGGTRHSFHFFPLIALGMGAAAQAGWDAMRRRARPGHEAALLTAGFVLSALVILGIVWHHSRSDYLRRYNADSWREYPIKVADYRQAMDAVLTMRPEDLVFASYQSVAYLEMETGRRWIPATDELGMLNYLGHDWFIAARGDHVPWGMPAGDELRQATNRLLTFRGSRPGNRLWIINIGWAGELDWIHTDPYWSQKVDIEIEIPAVGIYTVPVERLR